MKADQSETPSRYRTIVADPPWAYSGGFSTESHNARTGERFNAKRRALPYGSMSPMEIASLPVQEWTETDAFLFLWTTNRYIADAFGVMQAWSFEYRQIIVWSKSKDYCLPATIAPIHAEFLLVGKRGAPKRIGTFPSSVLEATRTKQHSAKPDLFLDHIEAACPGPYLEMFARRARFGWDYWGNQSLETAEVAA